MYCSVCGAPASSRGTTTRAGRRLRSRVVVIATVLGAAILIAGGFAAAQLGNDDDGTTPVTFVDETDHPQSTAPPSPTSPPPATPNQQDFSDLYDAVNSGIFMVRATTCEGTGVGSGFLTSDGTLVTAAHVVAEAASVAIVRDGAAYEATVVGTDHAADVAVLAIASDMDGHNFDLADVSARAGEPLAVLGHPLGAPLTMTTGTVSRVDESLWPDFQLDVSVSPGNSGGPVLRADGDVVGLTVAKDTQAEGLGYATHATVVADLLANPDLLTPPSPPACDRPLGPNDAELPDVPTSDELHEAIANTFANYFGGINSGDYALAFDQLSPRLQDNHSPADFAAGLVTSFDFGFEILSVDETADGAIVWLEFVSIQDSDYGADGEPCTNWSLDYELVWFGDVLLIDHVTGHDDTPGHAPCS